MPWLRTVWSLGRLRLLQDPDGGTYLQWGSRPVRRLRFLSALRQRGRGRVRA